MHCGRLGRARWSKYRHNDLPADFFSDPLSPRYKVLTDTICRRPCLRPFAFDFEQISNALLFFSSSHSCPIALRAKAAFQTGADTLLTANQASNPQHAIAAKQAL